MTESSRVEDETGGTASPGPWRARITGMDCGSCALTIADGLRKIAGVRAVAVDFTTETLEISGEITREQVEQRLKLLGYGLAPQLTPEAAMARAAAARSADRFFAFLLADTQQRLALAAALAILATTLLAALTPGSAASALKTLSLAAAVGLVGAPIFIKGLRALLFSRRVTIDLLMMLAALGALVIGEAGEAATVVLLFTFGEGLERFSAARARDSLRSLMSLQPQTER